MSTPIHQEIALPATADNVFEILTDAVKFAAFSGAPATIEGAPGGAFSCFGGQVSGRMIELVPGKRIVQAWRVGAWDEGVYSVVRFDLEGNGEQTTLVMEHSGFPQSAGEHLEGGWHKMYWEPIRAHLT